MLWRGRMQTRIVLHPVTREARIQGHGGRSYSDEEVERAWERADRGDPEAQALLDDTMFTGDDDEPGAEEPYITIDFSPATSPRARAGVPARRRARGRRRRRRSGRRRW